VNFDIANLSQQLATWGTKFLLMLVGALALWVVGGWVIKLLVNLTSRALRLRNVDQTIISYLASTVTVVLKIALAVTILSVFGIQTTTFAALLAALGLAVGMAWSGLLANFAAGAFLIILRPFKAGDFITAGGVTGTVEEVGLFVTTINTPDNVRTFVGNNKIFSDNMQNFSANPYRRVELTAQLAHTTDPNAAIALLKGRVGQIPNVAAQPAPEVEVLTFTPMGPVLAVRPFTHNDHYWQVYFDTNRVIREAFGEAGYAVPEQHYAVRGAAAGAAA
jgi:small conductance mechanosensitive channel